MSAELAGRVAALEHALDEMGDVLVDGARRACSVRPCGRAHVMPLGSHFSDVRCPDCPINRVDWIVERGWQRRAQLGVERAADLFAERGGAACPHA